MEQNKQPAHVVRDGKTKLCLRCLPFASVLMEVYLRWKLGEGVVHFLGEVAD